MFYAYGNVAGPHAEHFRRARAERAKVATALSRRAVEGLGAAVRWIGGGMWRAGRTALSGTVAAWRRRVAVRQLQALDDRMLKDIGISRSEIHFMVRDQLSLGRATRVAATRRDDRIPAQDPVVATPAPRHPLRPAA